MNKTALITGASSGLGREFARICAGNGYDLVITARNTDALNALKNELEAKFGVRVFVFGADLSQITSVDKICEFVRENSLKIDILINNAGFGDHGEFAKSDLKKQLEMVQVNIASLLNLTHYFANLMIERGGGKILNIASAASLTAGPKMSVYYASKAFVRNFSLALAEELKDKNISVTAFCPGPVATNFGERAGVKNAKIFARSDDAGAVARRGFEAMMSGKTLVYDGRFIGLANLLTRIFPLKFCAKVTGFLNG
ncbi:MULTISPECIES: SDR family NAD(P)-dependent oxidoreductase [unclassified Campylobacter]|uniref:SDR family NAD(P)-dependent oxidoreductase n=1 Tax=unclassified Campylobacter TaxID=2593542 RepID=UPI0022E9BFCD|nr:MULTISPECIES: SDR family oxidoreductase [unclassified Campylobacter]MDA3043917.1 SDR family oxidoreductase [Campylobacter sp. JMF_09 ED2]MDA3045454.1 SDR family oxidoreductase [Campylobacter sp. JMF_07 ED4]MDA3064126.1 SDR family oxidoreductase [Campylobacter sp. JMF_11 EL3]MDA3072002.1 SDR family oxidoreductase [Campylobacter sp. VBCF_03 NA9]MDA3075733.1 SDR family oxidoreductase [Campylobacter sp. JMF_05 ED3]